MRSVVIPVRGGDDLLGPCLASILPQLAAADELIVVDDASQPPVSGLPSRVALVRSDRPVGPYDARNLGWRRATGDLVCFTDMRCRAEPGWLDRLGAAFTDPQVTMACSDVVAVPGVTVAERVVAARRHLDADRFVNQPWFLPYHGTHNLAVRRSVLEAVGGFRPYASGGDADLCWRIQLAGLGTLRLVDGLGMTWQPRATAREALQQWRKYGRSGALLRWEYRDHGADTVAPISRRAIGWEFTRRSLGHLLKRRLGPRFSLLDAGLDAAYHWGYRESYHVLHRGQPTV